MDLPLQLSDRAIVSRIDGHLSTVVGGETVIMSVDTGRFHVVADTGAMLWDLIARPQTFSELIGGLAAEFEVDVPQCRADVEEFLLSLVARGLATVEDPAVQTKESEC